MDKRFEQDMPKQERLLYTPIVGKLKPRDPEPPILHSYLSIFHDGAEVPLSVFTQEDVNSGYVEAIAGLLEKRVLALKVRENGVTVYARPIESVIKFKE